MTNKEKIFKASGYSILSELVAKIISPLGFLILTRLLAPQDFGVVAIATTILNFIFLLSDLGVGNVIIQERADNDYLYKINNVAFWFSGILGLTFCLLIILSSSFLAKTFGEPKSTSVISVMAIQIVFYSFSVVQNANKKRELNFKFLFFLRFVTVLVPILISIPLAFNGYNYWAIVWGQVFGSFVSTIVLWYNSTWKPSFSFDFKVLKRILSKSIWSTIEQVALWIPIVLDTYLISNYLSSKDLGLYSTSKTFFTSAITLSLGALIPVLYSVYSSIKDDNEYFRKVVLLSQKLVFAIAIFMGIGVFIFRYLIERIIFTSSWFGISEIFGVIFFLMGSAYFNSVIVEGLRAKGYFKIVAINTLICILLEIPILYISIRYGLFLYVILRSSLLFFLYPGVFYFSNKKLGISFVDCIKNSKYTIVFSIGLLLLYFIIKLYFTDFYLNLFLFFVYFIMIALYIFFEKITFKVLFNQLHLRKFFNR